MDRVMVRVRVQVMFRARRYHQHRHYLSELGLGLGIVIGLNVIINTMQVSEKWKNEEGLGRRFVISLNGSD